MEDKKNCAGGLEQQHVQSIIENGWLENIHTEKLNNLYSSRHVVREIKN